MQLSSKETAGRYVQHLFESYCVKEIRWEKDSVIVKAKGKTFYFWWIA